jgi:hypothetical protein
MIGLQETVTGFSPTHKSSDLIFDPTLYFRLNDENNLIGPIGIVRHLVVVIEVIVLLEVNDRMEILKGQ